MTRTLRERLTARDAGPAVGTLCRVTDPDSAFFGMSGRIAYHDRFMLGVVGLRMTSTGHVLSFNVGDLTPVLPDVYVTPPAVLERIARVDSACGAGSFLADATAPMERGE